MRDISRFPPPPSPPPPPPPRLDEYLNTEHGASCQYSKVRPGTTTFFIGLRVISSAGLSNFFVISSAGLSNFFVISSAGPSNFLGAAFNNALS